MMIMMMMMMMKLLFSIILICFCSGQSADPVGTAGDDRPTGGPLLRPALGVREERLHQQRDVSHRDHIRPGRSRKGCARQSSGRSNSKRERDIVRERNRYEYYRSLVNRLIIVKV